VASSKVSYWKWEKETVAILKLWQKKLVKKSVKFSILSKKRKKKRIPYLKKWFSSRIHFKENNR